MPGLRGIAAALAALWLASLPAMAMAQSSAGTLVRIAAEGKASAQPDLMTVSAGVTSTGATAAQALADNNVQTARLIAAVKGSGIALRSLRTSGLAVTPRFAPALLRQNDGEEPRIVGFVARNMIDVEMSDIATAGRLISLMFEAGANSVSGPRFALSSSVAARRAAERSAIADARAQAANYADALDMKVVRLLRITDATFREDRNGDAIVVMGSRIAATPIEPGQVETKVTLSAEFLLEPR
jgi:uncharacterized protein